MSSAKIVMPLSPETFPEQVPERDGPLLRRAPPTHNGHLLDIYTNMSPYVKTEVKSIPSKYRLEVFIKQINAEILLC